MLLLCWILAIIYLLFGVVTTIWPRVVRVYANWFYSPARTRIASVVGVIVGALCWHWRHATHLPSFVGAYAIVAGASSLIYLLLPWEHVSRLYRRSIDLSDAWCRIYGVLSLFLAACFAIAARGY